MQLIRYSFIGLLLLISNVGIRAEPPSVSFITLIPNIIASNQLIQDDLPDVLNDFDQMVPRVETDLTLGANASNCSRDLLLLFKDWTLGRIWALKTMDAWGKKPSGVMRGNIYWIGSVDECEHHLRGLNNTVVEQPFRTRTCVIGRSDSHSIQPVYGLCVPESCSENDIFYNVNQRIIPLPFIRRFIHITNDSIQCIDRRSYDAKAIATIVLLTLIILLILIATGLHIASGNKYDTSLTAYEPIISQTVSATNTSATTNTVTTTTVNTSLSGESVDEEGEVTPLITRSRQNVDTAALNLIGCCSLRNSYYRLKHKSPLRILECLNGIRVLSLWWVMLGHTFLFAVYYSDNALTIFNWSRQFWFQIIVQSPFSLDSFFLLSGILTTFLFLISKVPNARFSTVKFLLNHYIYRYLRYTIVYALILLVYIALSPYFGQDGPIYRKSGIESLTCRQTWWRNLLYINNFFDLRDSCMPVTWFLAVNMQFHWIAPLFLLAISWKWFLGLLVTALFIIIDIITTSIIVSKNDYDHGLLSDAYHNTSNWSSTSQNYLNDVYIKPWCRLIPYAIGLLVGYILYDMYRDANPLFRNAFFSQERLHRYNRLTLIFAWILAIVILALCVFGTYGDYSGHDLSRAGRIAFLTLSRFGWAFGLSLIIMLCFIEHGGIVNRLLSHTLFVSMAKLTYGAFLWHSLVLFVNYFSRDQPTHYTVANILFNSFIHILLSYLLSFFTYLFIESPSIQLLRHAFKRPSY